MKYALHFAPLQGYTDAIYREVHAAVFGGVEEYYTPFVRLEKGEFRKKDVNDITSAANATVSVVPQLIAATPDEFRRIARLFEAEGYRRADINLGCPFPKQVRMHRGAGLLPYTEECMALLRTVEEFPAIRFSVKMRLGWERSDEAEALLPFLHTLPLKHITLHPRLGIQQYKGEIDEMGWMRFMENCRLPLYYNGDIRTPEDIETLTTRFPSLAGVMVGRGLLARPWLAYEYRTGETLSDTCKRERLRTFHTLLSEKYRQRMEGGEHQVLTKLKTLWDYLLPDAEKKLRKRIVKSPTLPTYQKAVDELIVGAEMGW